MSAPIWVVDPTGNNNPYLIVLSPPIFVIAADGIFDGGGNQTGNAQIFWSTDGINWTIANNEAGGFLDLQTGSGMNYYNGIWAINQRYTYAPGPLVTQIVVYSYTGKDFKIGLNPVNPAISNIVSMTNDVANNRIVLANASSPTVYLNARTPASPGLKANFDISAPMDDPAQPTTGLAGYLSNSLPGGLTAVRFKINGPVTPPFTFDYTKTSITTDVVNSGAAWPAAQWVTSLTLDSSQARSSMGYGQVT